MSHSSPILVAWTSLVIPISVILPLVDNINRCHAASITATMTTESQTPDIQETDIIGRTLQVTSHISIGEKQHISSPAMVKLLASITSANPNETMVSLENVTVRSQRAPSSIMPIDSTSGAAADTAYSNLQAQAAEDASNTHHWGREFFEEAFNEPMATENVLSSTISFINTQPTHAASPGPGSMWLSDHHTALAIVVGMLIVVMTLAMFITVIWRKRSYYNQPQNIVYLHEFGKFNR